MIRLHKEVLSPFDSLHFAILNLELVTKERLRNKAFNIKPTKIISFLFGSMGPHG